MSTNKPTTQLDDFDGVFAHALFPVVDPDQPDASERNRKISGAQLASELGGVGGGGGASRYNHVQVAASATWTVNHNLGVEPAGVSVRSPGGIEVIAQVTHTSLNQLIVTFAAPATGRCVVM